MVSFFDAAHYYLRKFDKDFEKAFIKSSSVIKVFHDYHSFLPTFAGANRFSKKLLGAIDWFPSPCRVIVRT